MPHYFMKNMVLIRDCEIKKESMFIHKPDPKLSTAENLLMMMRQDKKFTSIEAKVLDTALILHMEHGGGNNSTFTTRVVHSYFCNCTNCRVECPSHRRNDNS